MIIVKAYRPCPNKGVRIGFVDLLIEDEKEPRRNKTENNLEVCSGKFGKWVQWQSYPNPEIEGEWIKRSEYTEKGVQKQFSDAVIAELEKFAPEL